MLLIAAALPLLSLAAANPVSLLARADENANKQTPPPVQIVLHLNNQTSVSDVRNNYFPSDVAPRLPIDKYTPEQAARKAVIYTSQIRKDTDKVTFPGLMAASYPGVLAEVDGYEVLDGQRGQISFKIATPEMKEGVFCALVRKNLDVNWSENAQGKTFEYNFAEYDWWTGDDGIINTYFEREMWPSNDPGEDTVRLRCGKPERREEAK